MKQFKTERSVQQQRLICDSLVALMGERSYSQVTVSDLCIRAGIPRRTFYYYYEGRDAVLSDLIEGILLECDLEGMFSPSLDRSGVEESFARFFRYWRDRRRRELEVFVKNDLGQMLVQQSMQRIPTDKRWDAMQANLPEDRRIIASLLSITCVLYTLFYWQQEGFVQTPEQLAKNVTDLLTNPIHHVK